ncbi:hypothetical protein PENARI_c006G03754 [Penicillium arizonense]|uniref:Rhodopsin domain-containing protein n=1 Tax=Penicillium arizonense TaxID=1835702 RepID=A0A1F5LN21_PENAI|nr:hypothetical protein PENARI_c006G03754 [Penicillium arizonense]OGE54603.1 hypothetical protein PENARI_c006G03754 [Penicillium arizonense]
MAFSQEALLPPLLPVTPDDHASSHGIGKHRHALSDSSFETYSKALYASQLFSVLVLACSKSAVVLLVLSLKPFERISAACKITLGLIGAWALAALVALGVQCDQPHPWSFSPERCLNQHALYISLAAFHMLLDMCVIGLPVTLLHQVQIIQWKRHHISALFAMRVLVLALTIAGLHSLQPLFNSKPLDRPWHALMPAIWLQLILSSSILCTCIPTLKRVLADLQTGMMAGTVSDFFEQSVSGQNSKDRSTSKSGSGIGQRSGSATHSSSPISVSHGDRPSVERVDSQKILRDNAIVHTVDYDMRYDGAEPGRASSSSAVDSFLFDDDAANERISVHHMVGGNRG